MGKGGRGGGCLYHNCFHEAVKKLLKCYSSSSRRWWHPVSRNSAGILLLCSSDKVNKAICERVRESDESTEYYAIVIVIAAQSQLARENALKISGQLVVRKEKERKERKREKKNGREMRIKIRFIRHMPEISVARLERDLARYVLCIRKHLSPFTTHGSESHEMRFILILTHAAYHTW